MKLPKYAVHVATDDPQGIADLLNAEAKRGYSLVTVRRIREDPFRLLVFLKRRGTKEA